MLGVSCFGGNCLQTISCLEDSFAGIGDHFVRAWLSIASAPANSALFATQHNTAGGASSRKASIFECSDESLCYNLSTRGPQNHERQKCSHTKTIFWLGYVIYIVLDHNCRHCRVPSSASSLKFLGFEGGIRQITPTIYWLLKHQPRPSEKGAGVGKKDFLEPSKELLSMLALVLVVLGHVTSLEISHLRL